MNNTRTPTPQELSRTADRFQVDSLLRAPGEPLNTYLARVQEQFPLDLPTYQQEALLEFAETHGAYPPILILADQPHLVEQWHETLKHHREQHGTRTITKQLAQHKELIQERLSTGMPVLDIATELNCSSSNLRAYLRTLEAGK